MAMSTKTKKVPMSKAGSQHKPTGGRLSSTLITAGAKPGTQVARAGHTGQMTACTHGEMYPISVKSGKGKGKY